MGETSFPSFPLAELHAHLGTSINPSIYWQIAHEQGFKLPKQEYKEFIDYVMLSPTNRSSINDYFEKIYHPLLDKLSSGTHAVEKAVYEIMSGAYRNNITLLELRTNPMKHNHGGDVDLDHVIMAMLRGMERALLEYKNLSAGIIFCMAREFSYEQNEIIAEKAMKYHRRGIIGIDFAGPAHPHFHYKDYTALVDKARRKGLKVTAHSGEVEDANDMWDAVTHISPDRIGHGWLASRDKELMKDLARNNTVIEFCPMSNIMTKFQTVDDIKEIVRAFLEHDVKFTINTDWPEVMEGAHLWRQFAWLKEEGILTEEQLKKCNKTAFESTFIPPGGINAYL